MGCGEARYPRFLCDVAGFTMERLFNIVRRFGRALDGVWYALQIVGLIAFAIIILYYVFIDHVMTG